jgi:hypothetical protein
MGRVAGWLWLTCIATSVLSFMVIGPLIVRSDAAATTANIIANEALFRFGSAANLLSGLSHLGVTVLLYSIFKPVNKLYSLAAAFSGVVGVSLGAAISLMTFASLSLLHGSQYSALPPSQLQAITLFVAVLPDHAMSVLMIFFGVQMFLVAILILRSRLLPAVIGMLLAMGGASYIALSLTNLLAPSLGRILGPVVMVAALLGEGSMTIWLLVRGVDEQRWIEHVRTARSA